MTEVEELIEWIYYALADIDTIDEFKHAHLKMDIFATLGESSYCANERTILLKPNLVPVLRNALIKGLEEIRNESA